jgi:hypothetical protein
MSAGFAPTRNRAAGTHTQISIDAATDFGRSLDTIPETGIAFKPILHMIVGRSGVEQLNPHLLGAGQLFWPGEPSARKVVRVWRRACLATLFSRHGSP